MLEKTKVLKMFIWYTVFLVLVVIATSCKGNQDIPLNQQDSIEVEIKDQFDSTMVDSLLVEKEKMRERLFPTPKNKLD